MNQIITIYYQERPATQVSTDEKTWIPITGYNQFDNPYFTLNEHKDWCTISFSKSGEWLICFVKINDSTPTYYRGFAKPDSLSKVIIFECQAVTKHPLTNKWVKVNNNPSNSYESQEN